MGWNDEWVRQAACLASDNPDALFVPGAAQHEAKAICRACPVRTECLAEALDGRLEWGVWGGMTERERRAILRRRPTVTSWRKLLEAERDAFERQRAATVRPAARTAGPARTGEVRQVAAAMPAPVSAGIPAARGATPTMAGREGVTEMPAAS